MLFERTLVGTALCGVLSVDKRVVFLTVLVGVGEGYLDVFALHVDNGVEHIDRHVVGQQVLQTVAADDALAIVHDGEALVQVGIVAKHRLDDIVVEAILLEKSLVVVGLEEDKSTGFIAAFRGFIGLQDAPFEGQCAHLALAIASHLEVRAQCVDGFHTDTVQADTLLESLRVVLTACIQHADGLDELSLRDAAAIVAHRHTQVVVDIDLDALAGIHLELVDGVVDDLLQQHINTVLGQRTVAQTTDIHTRARPDMLHVRQMAYVVVGIFNGVGC